MSVLQFTEEAARQLEALYLTSDVVAQRSEILRRLGLTEGNSVIDIGCGPGFLCESMAATVAPSGRVVGIDTSPELIALCQRRNPTESVQYRVGDAVQIDEAGASFDVAVCVQVAEYVPDVGKVLAEAFRVLKQGGRAVFVATDWDAVIWHSDSPYRMAAVMKSWEAHCAHPRLPRFLSERLRGAGFVLDGVSVFPILNMEWSDDKYSKGLSELVRVFVRQRGDVGESDLAAWAEELPRMSSEGRYFFSSARFIFEASKPFSPAC